VVPDAQAMHYVPQMFPQVKPTSLGRADRI
jgi:hypothetical protein